MIRMDEFHSIARLKMCLSAVYTPTSTERFSRSGSLGRWRDWRLSACEHCKKMSMSFFVWFCWFGAALKLWKILLRPAAAPPTNDIWQNSLSEASEETRKSFGFTSATTRWPRDQPECSSADIVIIASCWQTCAYRMNEVVSRELSKPKNDRKLQKWTQICCGKFYSIKVIMVHACVCAVRRGIDVKTKNDVATQGLWFVKYVNRFCISEAWEKIDSLIILVSKSEINVFWQTCSGDQKTKRRRIS